MSDPTEPSSVPTSGDAEVPASHPHHHLGRSELSEALIAAEMETGRREETVEQAKRNVALRIVRIVAGFLVLGAGLAMLALPGPGWITIAFGLYLLSEDIPFARRLRKQIEARIPAGEDGKPKTWVLVMSGILLAASIAGVVWWFFLRG